MDDLCLDMVLSAVGWVGVRGAAWHFRTVLYCAQEQYGKQKEAALLVHSPCSLLVTDITQEYLKYTIWDQRFGSGFKLTSYHTNIPHQSAGWSLECCPSNPSCTSAKAAGKAAAAAGHPHAGPMPLLDEDAVPDSWLWLVLATVGIWETNQQMEALSPYLSESVCLKSK